MVRTKVGWAPLGPVVVVGCRTATADSMTMKPKKAVAAIRYLEGPEVRGQQQVHRPGQERER